MVTKILLVEDDEKLGLQIVQHLRGAGFELSWLVDGASAMKVEPEGFELLVLDLMLPGVFGLDVLQHWRKRSDRPVLVLSAKNDTDVKVRALELGADDYLTKPFWPEELLARIEARLRRPLLAHTNVVEVGPIAIDLAARSAAVRGRDVELTRVEFDLLAALARRAGAAVSRRSLIDDVLASEREGGERALDGYVSRLRKKLGPDGALLATIWGVGYRLREREMS